MADPPDDPNLAEATAQMGGINLSENPPPPFDIPQYDSQEDEDEEEEVHMCICGNPVWTPDNICAHGVADGICCICDLCQQELEEEEDEEEESDDDDEEEEEEVAPKAAARKRAAAAPRRRSKKQK